MKTPKAFMEYFRTNYPGPDTIISKPDWHAPKIYAAALAASGHHELLNACKEVIPAIVRSEMEGETEIKIRGRI